MLEGCDMNMQMTYSDSLRFSDHFSYINLFHLSYGLFNMIFQSLYEFSRNFLIIKFISNYPEQENAKCTQNGTQKWATSSAL